MGNLSFRRRKDCSPVRKCPKTENTCDVNKNGCIKRHQPCFPFYHQTCLRRWEALPYVALVEIYKHLSNTDKASMGLTCKAWLLPFTRPALWRRGNFRFDGYGDERALQFAAVMGSALRHVVVDCSAPKEKVSSLAEASSSVKFCLFLKALITTNNKKLETVCVRNLCRLFRYWIQQTCIRGTDQLARDLDPLLLLTVLLKLQDGIRRLDVTNASILADQAIRLLESIQYPCQIDHLSIADVVTHTQRFQLPQNTRFVSVIASYTGLNELRLSEEYLSHELLMTLTRSTALTLKFLEVNVLYKIRRHQSLENAWECFCNSMTKVKISFIVKGVFPIRDVARVMPSTVRLSKLEWDLANSVADFKLFYLHIVKFRDFLQFLRITVNFTIETDVTLFSYAVQRLPNLRILDINSPIIQPIRLYQLETSLRRYLNSGPPKDRDLKDVFLNGARFEPTETWLSYVAGWVRQQTLNWEYYSLF